MREPAQGGAPQSLQYITADSHQPNGRDRHTIVLAGHRQSGRSDQELYGIGSGFLRLATAEGCAVDSDKVKNDGDLSLSQAGPLGEFHAPSTCAETRFRRISARRLAAG